MTFGTCPKDGAALQQVDPFAELPAPMIAPEVAPGRPIPSPAADAAAWAAREIANRAQGALVTWLLVRCPACGTSYVSCRNCGTPFIPAGGVPQLGTLLDCPNCNARLG